MRRLACYLTSHGYGHAVRSVEVLRRLALRAPGRPLTVVADVPEFLLRPVLSLPGVAHERRAVDFGLVQRDPLHIDHAESGRRLARYLAEFDGRVRAEQAFLARFDAVYADVPFLAFAAAARAGLPSAGLGNFTWSWIYAHYAAAGGPPAFAEAAALAAACEARAGLYLQLPGGPPAQGVDALRHVPLVCRTEAAPRDQVRRALGLAPATRAVLVGFSELHLAPEAYDRLRALPGTAFIAPAPLQFPVDGAIRPDPGRWSFPDLVRAADVLVTKPGYGIVSDAAAAGVPLVHTDRGDFPEVPYLVRLVDETVGGRFLAREPFERGEWGPALEGLAPVRVRARTDGAEIAAALLADYFDRGVVAPAP